MKSFQSYQQERREMAETLESLNNAACRHFAELLRLNDQQKRMSMELGEKPEDAIPQRYFEIVYRVLSFGEPRDRLILMLGTEDEIDALVSKIERERGFYGEKGHWFEA